MQNLTIIRVPFCGNVYKKTTKIYFFETEWWLSYMPTTRIEYTIDPDTGEVMDTKSTVIQFEREPAYVKVYLDGGIPLLCLSKYTAAVLVELLRRAPFAGEYAMFSISKGLKERISSRVGCSIDTVNRAVSELTKRGILIIDGRASYRFNPYRLARGSWKSVQQQRIEFDSRSNR